MSFDFMFGRNKCINFLLQDVFLNNLNGVFAVLILVTVGRILLNE